MKPAVEKYTQYTKKYVSKSVYMVVCIEREKSRERSESGIKKRRKNENMEKEPLKIFSRRKSFH